MAGISPQTKLITEERKRIDFDVEEITNVIDGGPENTAVRRGIVDQIQSDPIMGDLDHFYKDGEEKYINALKRTLRLSTMQGSFSEKDENVARSLFIGAAKELALPIHAGAFVPTVENLGSPEQVEKWIPLAKKFNIIGTYAQTELGHGTNLRGLETTATFVPETQEFVIDCPKLTSMKWWPGDLGKGANHAVVMADLIINGQRYGMHPFIVQIRDLDTHMPMPGIKVGDIGEKFAFEINDNGFLIMDHVRIPRENMLAGVAEVDPEGNYGLKSDPRVLYGGMMLIRVRLVDSQAIIPLQMACTIATRYSIVRTQGSIKPGEAEVPVFDYVTQQHKILPLLAASYAYHFAARRTRKFYLAVIENMKGSGDFSDLPELHCLSAGMKSYITEKCLAGTDICRRACGGHGYLKASGFPAIYLQQLASVTYEGENTVMYLQCARHLVKCASAAADGKSVKGSASYLNVTPTKRCPANSTQAMSNHGNLLQAFRHRANFVVQATQQKIQRLQKSGHSQHDAWNMTSVELVEMAKVHLDLYVLTTFLDTLRETNASGKNKGKLANLCSLWALHAINENVGDLLKDGYFDSKQAQIAMEAELALLGVVRKDALGLVDAFDFTDKTLRSCLGAYDGNVYERLYENAKRSPRNKTEVHEGFYKLLRPHLHKGRDALQGTKSKL